MLLGSGTRGKNGLATATFIGDGEGRDSEGTMIAAVRCSVGTMDL
jgi:hypothetical protein